MEGNKKIVIRPITEYESIKTATSGLADNSNYVAAMPIFCEFVGKDPDQILAERKAHLKSNDEEVQRTYERKVAEFYKYLQTKYKSPRMGKPMADSGAFTYAGVVRGFFHRNYLPKMVFRLGDMRAPKTKSRDYTPTIGEVKEITDAADIRDKAVIIFELQTGMAPVDTVGQTRADWEPLINRGAFPCAVGWLMRTKTREAFHPFLFRDTAIALKRYLQNRMDSDPHLFVDRSGVPFQERNVNEIFQKAAEKAKIVVPEGKHLRVYCLRSIFETQMQNGGMPQTWTDMMMGHTVGGSRAKYTKPPENDWLEKARKAETFISVSRVSNIITLRQKIDGVRKDDMLELMRMLEKELGVESMKRLATAYTMLRPEIDKTNYNEDDLMPSKYVMADACMEYLALRKKRTRGA